MPCYRAEITHGPSLWALPANSNITQNQAASWRLPCHGMGAGSVSVCVCKGSRFGCILKVVNLENLDQSSLHAKYIVGFVYKK